MWANENFTAHCKKSLYCADKVRSQEQHSHWRNLDIWAQPSLLQTLWSSLAYPHTQWKLVSTYCFHSSASSRAVAVEGGAPRPKVVHQADLQKWWAELRGGHDAGQVLKRPALPLKPSLTPAVLHHTQAPCSIPMVASLPLSEAIKIAHPIILLSPPGPQGLQHHYQD